MVFILYSFLKFIQVTFGPIYFWIVTRVLSLIYIRSAKHVPPTDNPILLHTATDLAKKIRKRQLTATEVMEAYIERVKVTNPFTNAVVFHRFEDALSEARKVDEILNSSSVDVKYSESSMPFLGVPLSIKECFSVKGYESTTGLVARKGRINRKDAPIIINLKSAGFIPFVFTNVSELCMWYESSNYLYGKTCNAYDTSRIVGGSSGGEACNLSAAGAVVGIGSDIGGSIRMPAFFNGVFGHKATYGIVNNLGQYPVLAGSGSDDSILSTGPMCRYATDLIPLLKVLAGPNASKLQLDTEVDFRSMQFFTMADMCGGTFVSKVDPELKEAQKRVCNHFVEKYGCRTHTVRLDDMQYLLEIWMAEMHLSSTHQFSYFMSNEKGDINIIWELFKWFARISYHTLPALGLCLLEKLTYKQTEKNLPKLLKKSKELRRELTNLLSTDSVFLFPSHPRICPYHNQPLFHPFDFAYTAGFNALRLPVTQCPLGLSRSGHPIGVQVVSAAFHDHLSLAVAREIEVAFGGWTMPGTSRSKQD